MQIPRTATIVFARALGAAVLAFSAMAFAAEPAADEAARSAAGLKLFDAQVSALLKQHCVKCHGGDKTEAEFDLTSRDALLRGGEHGATIVPGNAQASLLYKLITHSEEPNMPDESPKLPDDAIAAIGQWIDAVAPYSSTLAEVTGLPVGKRLITNEDRKFWSFRPLAQPQPPACRNDAWCRTPIDRFVLQALETAGIAPNGECGRRQWIRRAYFDLIGLPPSPEEVAAFLADKSPAAFDKVIDHLLSSPHYGERWGRHWLDLARFAESHGYEHDYDRPFAYHYRDFVIRAFNADMPFDQFVGWQIAGDELAPDNPLALMATGFLGAGMHATQITANQVEKERYDELDDMAATVGTAMLGLTVGCARCHDHKFDPIPQADYYRLISTFTTTVRSEIDLDLDPEANRKAREDFDRQHAPLVEALATYQREQLASRFEAWLAAGAELPAPPWLALEAQSIKSEAGATFLTQADGSYLASGTNGRRDTVYVRQRDSFDGHHGRSARSARGPVDGQRRAGSGGKRQLCPLRLPLDGDRARRPGGAGQVCRRQGDFRADPLAAGGRRHRRGQDVGLGRRSSVRQRPCGSFRTGIADRRRARLDADIYTFVCEQFGPQHRPPAAGRRDRTAAGADRRRAWRAELADARRRWPCRRTSERTPIRLRCWLHSPQRIPTGPGFRGPRSSMHCWRPSRT